MWYKAVKFTDEQHSGASYFPLLDALKKHGRSVSVYRLLERGIPHVVAIHDSQPSRELESIIATHLAKGTPVILPDETVQAVFARREQNLAKAAPTSGSRAWAYEQHHQVTPQATRKRDVPTHTQGHKPLVERYITYERTQGNGKMDQAKIYHRQVSITLAQTPHKYLWTPSACAMAAYLIQPLILDSQPYMMSLPHDRHLWIEFEQVQTRPEGEIDGLFLMVTSDKPTLLEAVKSYHPPKEILQRFLVDIQAEPQVETWTLTLVGIDGLPIWNMGIESKGNDATWLPTPWYRCPWGRCRTEQKPDGTLFHLCDGCRDVLAHWMSWTNTAWLMIRGDFQEREEVEKPEERIVRTTRKVPRTDKPNKFTEIAIEHHYHVIRFDASVRKVAPTREAVEHRGSWVELAREIDPEAVVYVDKNIGTTSRVLRHERFTHKRGQMIAVKAYQKRIPMRVDQLRRKLVRVEAARFQEAETPHA